MKKMLSSIVCIASFTCGLFANDSLAMLERIAENPELSPYYDTTKPEIENVIFDLLNPLYSIASNINGIGSGACEYPDHKKDVQELEQSALSTKHKYFMDLVNYQKNYTNFADAFYAIRVQVSETQQMRFMMEGAKFCGIQIYEDISNNETLTKNAIRKFIIANYTDEQEKTKTVTFIAALNFYIHSVGNNPSYESIISALKTIKGVANRNGIYPILYKEIT